MARKQGHLGYRKPEGLLSRFLAIAVIISSFVFLAPAADAALKLDTIYHVYLDNEYIGTVSDQQVAEKAAEKAVTNAEKQFDGYELELGNQLTYISEQVFRSNAEDNAVEQIIGETAEINAVASSIVIGENTLVYLKNAEEAEAALEKFKLQFVSEKELAEAALNSKTRDLLPRLKKDDQRIVDVRILEEAEIKEEAVQPEQVLTSDDAVKLLEKGTLEEKKHVVQKGEVLGIIAAKYLLSSKQLMELNNGLSEESIIQIGQELNVVVTKPLLHVVVEREVYKEEVIPFEIETVEDSSMMKGDTKDKQTGKNGKSGLTYKVIEQNGKQKSKKTIKEVTIEKPVKRIVMKGTKVVPSRGTGSFAWPASGGYVSSKMGQRWGKLHKGIDIARPSNFTIKAADHGVVVSAGWDNSGYGNKIIIDHQNGLRTLYAHLKSVSVSPGQKIEKGSVIGVMGSTGHSTGIHLHFEVYKNGQLQNPLNYL